MPESKMDDKQLFDLWEHKIKIELTKDITSKNFSPWSLFHDFGHKSVANLLRKCHIGLHDIVLELGCGNCHFVKFLEKLNVVNYVGLEISRKMLAMAEGDIKSVQADMYKLPFPDGSISIVVSIYNLEHLHKLEQALDEIVRVLADTGIFIFAIPMEDGFAYNLGRNLTSKRLVEKKYSIDYMKIIREYEHPNTAVEILKTVNEKFYITKRIYFPFFIPSVNCNLFGVFKAVKA